MVRSVASKVAWVGRTASMVFGLALVMALVLGVSSVALAGNLDPLKIGSIKNVATKTTQLVGRVASGEALVVKNPSGGSALGLSVGDPSADPATKAVAPMKVNSQALVENLNADNVDGKSSEQFADAAHPHAGADITSGTVSEARIDGTVTRDSEVVPTVKANDGAGSGVDADTLDGQDSGKLGQMWAVVSSGCTIVRGSGASGIAPSNFCGVTFERDVSNCAFVASISESGAGYPGTDRTGEVWAYTGDGTPNGGSRSAVYVRTANSSGARVALPFHVAVFC